jgi:hypothetical protein
VHSRRFVSSAVGAHGCGGDCNNALSIAASKTAQ